MEPEFLYAEPGTAYLGANGKLIITVLRLEPFSSTALTIGYPGIPNSPLHRMGLGDAALFETPDGIFDVRVLSLKEFRVELMLSQVSPRTGVLAGYVDDGDATNRTFSPAEIDRIDADVDAVKRGLAQQAEITNEQLVFISAKLDEMKSAARRFGRRDWINLVIGTLTSAAVGAALSHEVQRALFRATGDALSWLLRHCQIITA